MAELSPHGNRLSRLLENPGLPKQDMDNVKRAVTRYNEWIRQMNSLNQPAMI